jgi:transcriptional regulator with XRE-family HTH domain
MERYEKIRAADVIQFALKERGRTQKSLAGELVIGAQTFSKKLANDTLSAREFLAAIDALGITITFSDKATGDEWKERKRGIVPRVSMMVDRVRYDTFKADALCHEEPFEDWIMELYRDTQGRYFLALYSTWGNIKPLIIPCGENDALRFYEAHKNDHETDVQ